MKKNALEWGVFLFSALLIVSVLTLLILDAMQPRKHGPQIEAHVGKSEKLGSHYRVPLTMTNEGDETAEGVMIEVTMIDAEGKEEKADFEILFMPRQSTRHGWVTFTSDPTQARSIEARAIGYEKP